MLSSIWPSSLDEVLKLSSNNYTSKNQTKNSWRSAKPETYVSWLWLTQLYGSYLRKQGPMWSFLFSFFSPWAGDIDFGSAFLLLTCEKSLYLGFSYLGNDESFLFLRDMQCKLHVYTNSTGEYYSNTWKFQNIHSSWMCYYTHLHLECAIAHTCTTP